MRSSQLLINEPPLQVLPSLAKAIGLNEAIVLQQIHYWLQLNRNKPSHRHQGKTWCYNSIADWKRDNFPFWSIRTIKRIFSNLRKAELIIVAKLSKDARNRTNWYTIDYKKLSQVAIALCQSDTMSLDQNGTMLTESKLFKTLVRIFRLNKKLLRKMPDKLDELMNLTSDLMEVPITAEQAEDVDRYWYDNDWRGLKNQPPTPKQFLETVGRWQHSQNGREDDAQSVEDALAAAGMPIVRAPHPKGK